MSTTRSSRLKRAATIVPLALLSAAWTASLATANPATTGSASDDPASGLPDGTEVPTEAIEAPASVSTPDAVGSAFDGDRADFDQIVANSSTNGIPASALAAYQRAETVINAADKSCQITWQLIAAIGRVESNHGRFGGSALDAEGLSQPGIFGIALNGTQNTATIRDTDAGRYDNDSVFDRAVGPMQFIPSTWAVVGVDADGDGERNPQDIDDAALATAVYLCSGSDDLSTLGGQRAAVFRYNHSQAYVDLVLSIMENYLAGDFMSVPDSTVAAGVISPLPPAPRDNGGRGGGKAAAAVATPTSPRAAPPVAPTRAPRAAAAAAPAVAATAAAAVAAPRTRPTPRTRPSRCPRSRRAGHRRPAGRRHAHPRRSHCAVRRAGHRRLPLAGSTTRVHRTRAGPAVHPGPSLGDELTPTAAAGRPRPPSR